MEPRKNTHSRKKRYRRINPLKRLFLVTLSVLIMLSGGIFGAEADTITDPGYRLKAFGPLDADNKFPVWYKDDQGTRLQLCLDVNDPNCALAPEEIPNPDAPISLETKNFPEESFYQLASSVIDLPNGRAVGTFALEATWANGIVQDGDQIVFGRIRFRIDGLVTGQTYKITHPYGVDEIVATSADRDNPENGEIRFVEDIGVTGGFGASMKSRVGRFLKWDTGAPDGYIGDPNQEHTITGGFVDKFKIEGAGVGNTCGTNCAETNLFSLMGKIATTAGVDVLTPTYSHNVDSNGNVTGGTIDVFASTEDDKRYNIEVSTGIEGDKVVQMNGGTGKYYARIDFTGENPPKITVTNRDDKPVTIKKDITPVDKITGNAIYNFSTKELTVTAESSDKVNHPDLYVQGFDKLGPIPKAGLKIPEFIPQTITINSKIGGSATIPVTFDGDPSGPLKANAGVDQTVLEGDRVTLNGKQSLGVGADTTIEWAQLPPITKQVVLNNANTLSPWFTAENGMGDLLFQLKLTGPNGVSETSTVKVTVKDKVIDPAQANAGPDQSNVTQGTNVTLDGSSSLNAIAYTWTQVDEPNVPKVTINSPDSAHPTFTFPKKFTPLKFKLQVKGQDGSISEDEVLITPVPDELTVVAPAEYRTRTSEWRLDGATNIAGPGVTVTLYFLDPNVKNADGTIKEQKIGSADVDPLKAWRYRGPGPIFTSGTIKVYSSSGDVFESVSIVRK
ncbi:IPT/TIG domain protein [Neobacillus pocheonensis]|uniref:PKD domain-containing protein n=1 Tax=Neobacillus pocheonensis TaxID=363869 RepID=UPI003D26976C